MRRSNDGFCLIYFLLCNHGVCVWDKEKVEVRTGRLPSFSNQSDSPTIQICLYVTTKDGPLALHWQRASFDITDRWTFCVL